MKKNYNYGKIQLEYYNRYKSKYTFIFTKINNACCYLKSRQIHIPLNEWMNPNKRSLFDFLHEIGHLETNTLKMKRYETEYTATVWAINEFNKIGLTLDKEDQEIYQNYINNFREKSIRLNAKNVASKEDIMLEW